MRFACQITNASVETRHNIECWFPFHGSTSFILRYAYIACLMTKTGSVYCAVRTESSKTSRVNLSLVGLAMAQAVSPRLLTAEAGVRSQVYEVCGGESCTATGCLWVLRSSAVTEFPPMLHTHPHLIVAFIRNLSWRILRFFQQTDAISDIASSPHRVLSLFAFEVLTAHGSIGGRRFCTACYQYRVMWHYFEIGHWVERTTGLALQVALWNSRLC